jgi:hypothetical protein
MLPAEALVNSNSPIAFWGSLFFPPPSRELAFLGFLKFQPQSYCSASPVCLWEEAIEALSVLTGYLEFYSRETGGRHYVVEAEDIGSRQASY